MSESREIERQERIIQHIATSLEEQIHIEISDALNKVLAENLGRHTRDAVSNALDKEKFRLSQDDNKLATELKRRNEVEVVLRSQLAGMKMQNSMQLRVIEAQAPRIEAASSPTTETQISETTGMIPFAMYDQAIQQNQKLRQLLSKAMEDRKLDASARFAMIDKWNRAKGACVSWKQHCDLLEAKLSADRTVSGATNASTGALHTPSQQQHLESAEELEAAWHETNIALGVSELVHDAMQDLTTSSRTITALPWRKSSNRSVSREKSVNPASNQPSTLKIAASRHYKVVPTERDSTSNPSTIPVDRSTNVAPLKSPGLGASTRQGPNEFMSRLQSAASSAPTAIHQQDTKILSSHTGDHISANFEMNPPTLSKKGAKAVTKENSVEFLSERSLKRRRDQPRTSAPALLIKREPSSPSFENYSFSFRRGETVDLDDLGAVVETPRKRRRLERTDSQRVQQHLRHERSLSEPAASLPPAFDSDETQDVPPQPINLVSDDAPHVLNEIDKNTRSVASSRRSARYALSKVSGDRSLRSDKRLKSKEEAFMQIANEEDEEEKENRQRQKHPNRARKENLKLQNLLGTTMISPIKRVISVSKPTRPSAPSPVKGPRLRNKPLELLNLGDFKYNPRINHGQYVHITKEARQCLPGCTDVRCCGEAIRAIAQTANFLKVPRNPNDEEDKLLDDDELVIKSNLGDRFDLERIRMMEQQEFREHLITARMALLASRFGRHKDINERRNTPLGYWEVGMPSTQEVHDRNAAAGEIEKEHIKYRWQEARKGNGKWSFIDE